MKVMFNYYRLIGGVRIKSISQKKINYLLEKLEKKLRRIIYNKKFSERVKPAY